MRRAYRADGVRRWSVGPPSLPSSLHSSIVKGAVPLATGTDDEWEWRGSLPSRSLPGRSTSLSVPSYRRVPLAAVNLSFSFRTPSISWLKRSGSEVSHRRGTRTLPTSLRSEIDGVSAASRSRFPLISLHCSVGLSVPASHSFPSSSERSEMRQKGMSGERHE